MARTGDHELAADLTAETFAAAPTAGHRRRPGGSATSWLYVIARTTLAGSIRSGRVNSRRRRALSMSPAGLTPADVEWMEQVRLAQEAQPLALLADLPAEVQGVLSAPVAGVAHAACGLELSRSELIRGGCTEDRAGGFFDHTERGLVEAIARGAHLRWWQRSRWSSGPSTEGVGMLGRVAVMVGVLALALAASAGAKGPVADGSDSPDPRGITMSGTGLARVTPPSRVSDETIRRAVDEARPTAVSRAINETRDRATTVAQAAGLTLGEVVAVEDQVGEVSRFGPFGGDRFCRRSRRRSARPRCEVPNFVAALVTVTFATSETGAAPLPERTIAATGNGDADVDPRRRTSRSIRRAILDAEIETIPGAVAAAREKAAALARSSGLLLGPIVSIAPPPSSPFGDPFFEVGIFGPFGVGEFCGTITRPVFRRDPQTGRRRVVRRVRQRRCFFPRSITTSLRVTFDGGA